MKDIKFRVWCEQEKEMYSHYHLHELAEVYQETPFRLITEGFAGLIAMQFTGLKDRNGRDIYEGDVLNDGKGHPPVPYGKVVWNPSVAAFNVLENGMYYWLNAGNQIGPLRLKHTEIIGNIYENPELIER